MTFKLKSLLIIAILVSGYFGRNYWLEKNGYAGKPGIARQQVAAPEAALPGKVFETAHYAISSTAKPGQTAQVAKAVESFHDAYAAFFAKEITASDNPEKLKLMLYKDRQEFSANNTSSPWAEAFYRSPVCYAYFSDSAENPYHWMIHEATHQLNRELAGFDIPKWVNEGLASYFGTSKIENGVLQPGEIDDTAYPIWWLSDLSLSGDLQNDIAHGKIIPLRAIITGKGGPDIGQNVNLYYIEYWSFTHFLLHHENGRYADGYRKLMAEGGSPEGFEANIGPIDRIQVEWYGYLRQITVEARGTAEPEMLDTLEIEI